MTQTNNLFVQINGDSVLYPLSSYATEDRNGQFKITNNQTQLELKGNTWKKLDFGVNYTITADTILEFDFQSTIKGEIHGLGFDNDNVLSTNWLFKLSGTQNVGLRDFDNYVTGSGWQTYQIPVGNFFTGDFQYFVLSNDHDVASPTGNGQFRNLRIYENVPPPTLDIVPVNAVQAEGDTGTTPFTFAVYRTGDTTGTSTVNWSVTGTGDNPATADDFGGGTLPSGTVTFTAGETTKEFILGVSGDIRYEPDEGFSVTLSDAVGAIINTDTAEGIILNDDVPATLDIYPANAVQAEGDTGTTPFTFTVTRSGDTTGTSSVNWAVTLSGGADAADFSLTPAATNNSQRERNRPAQSDAPNSQSDTTTWPYAPNRLIVKFNPEVTSTQANQIKNSLGVVKTQNIRLTGAEIWQLPETTSVETALATYGRSRVFEYIEPDYIVTTAATIPNDPDFNLLWGLHNTGQTGGTPDADIDAPEAWDIQTGDPNLVIGVIDTGVDYTHQDLVGNIWTNPGEIAGNGIDDDGNGYIDDIRGWDFAYNDNNPMDVNGHGTHVSGTIAGKGNNAVGVTGVAWNAKIMPLKFLDDTGSGWTSNAILAVDYATAQGVKLTNNSWGGGGYSQALYDAIAAAGDAGSLFIASAGNSSNNNDSSPSYPASYNLDNIISVASTTHTDGLSWFSNYGLTTVDLGAPGSSIYSTVPGNSYATSSGTSMASPHVAGAAALLWSENPTWTAQEVKDVLLQTVDPIGSLNGITVSGGRLNVYNALLATTTTLPSGTVEFAPGETTKEITVYVSGDTDFEGDEGFSVTLSDATGAIINTDTAEGTILNDDQIAQKITSSSNISAAPGGTVTIPLYYDTTTGDNSLPGISLRLHYNSTELTFNNASDLFLTNLFGNVKELPDNENFDNDVTTDRFLQLQYNDFTGDWPNQPLPLKLADFKFTATDSFTGTQVNFSSSNTAAGYALAANSVKVSQGWNLDIDGNGEIKALSDGVILMRHLFGSFIGNELIDGAIAPNATRDLVAIQAYLQEGVNQGHLDIDGNGSVGAYSDGIIAVRHMFGSFPGDALIHEALSPDATRDLAQIQNHLEQLTTLV